MIKRSLSERIGSIKAVQRYTGIIKFFCPETQQYCQLDFWEMIWRGILSSHIQKQKEKDNPSLADQGCNMNFQRNPNKKQRVYVITEINHRCLKMIFKAFKLNEEMLMEMSLR